MDTVHEPPDYPRGVTFEQVWASLEKLSRDRAELDAKWEKEREERAKEAEKRQKEEAEERQREAEERQREAEKRQKEAEEHQREAKERKRELEKLEKETNRKIGYLSDRLGDMIESLVGPNLENKFNEMGFGFTKTHHDTKIKDAVNNIYAQVDFTLENSGKVMIVEVKLKPSIQDIKEHVERLEKIRRHADLHGDKRIYLGAVAGVVLKENIRDFIHKNGFYSIEPSGETFNIIPPDNKPKEW